MRKQHKSCFIIIQEPFVSQKKQGRFARKLGFAGYAANCNNKIWCFWTSEVQVTVLRDHEQFLHIEMVHSFYPEPVHISCVYAKCGRSARIPLWKDLLDTEVDSAPRLVIGDFNVISNLQEQVRALMNQSGARDDFNDFIEDGDFHDLGFEGPKFTWSNGRVCKRLDRALCNTQWLSHFPDTRVKHLSKSCSDHNPLLLTVIEEKDRVKGGFRFQNMWCEGDGFFEVVSDTWNLPSEFHGIKKFREKMLRIKQRLRWWNRNVFGNIFDEITKIENEVGALEESFAEDNNPNNRTRLHAA